MMTDCNVLYTICFILEKTSSKYDKILGDGFIDVFYICLCAFFLFLKFLKNKHKHCFCDTQDSMISTSIPYRGCANFGYVVTDRNVLSISFQN